MINTAFPVITSTFCDDMIHVSTETQAVYAESEVTCSISQR